MGLALRDKAHHTYGDYISWSDETRYELVDGHAYAMVPAPLVSHQEVVGELYRQIADALDDAPCRAVCSSPPWMCVFPVRMRPMRTSIPLSSLI